MSITNITIDPLRNARIEVDLGGQTFTHYFEFGPETYLRVEQLKLIPYEPSELTDILNNNHRFSREVVPLPHRRIGWRPSGTRSFNGVINELFPDNILCFSGIGVVKGTSLGQRYHFSPLQLTVSKPEPQTPLTTVTTMGTLHTDAVGITRSVVNTTPLGAYRLDDLERKVRNTRVHNPDITVCFYGVHEDMGVGGMVYTLPKDVLTPVELLQMDLDHPASHLYGNMLYALFQKIGLLHDAGLAHLQIHPGNWYARYVNNEPAPIITDWETLTKIDNLPPKGTFDGKGKIEANSQIYFGHLPIRLRPLAIDLSITQISAALLTEEHFMLPYFWRCYYSKQKDITNDIRKVFDQQLEMLAYATVGYLGLPESKIPAFMTVLEEEWKRRSVLDYNEVTKKLNMRGVQDFDSLTRADRGDYAINGTRDKLILELSAQCVDRKYRNNSVPLLSV